MVYNFHKTSGKIGTKSWHPSFNKLKGTRKIYQDRGNPLALFLFFKFKKSKKALKFLSWISRWLMTSTCGMV